MAVLHQAKHFKPEALRAGDSHTPSGSELPQDRQLVRPEPRAGF